MADEIENAKIETMTKVKKTLLMLPLITLLSACGSQNLKPIHTVEHVDLKRFMGDWYVIANIPTFIETVAYNAIETYQMNDDGSIATTFTFRDGSPDGDRKQYNPTGFIVDQQSNALWDMQFIWPFKAEYRILFLSEDYSQTVIGRTKRDYVWIMARKKIIPDEEYENILNFLREQDYDLKDLRVVPHDR